MTALIVFIGGLIGGRQGVIFAFILAAGINFFSYFYSDKIVLKMYRAKEVTPSESPHLYRMVSELAERAHLPMPRIYIIPEETPNAFATGRNPAHAVVAVTRGLLNLMDRDEIMGVLAHGNGAHKKQGYFNWINSSNNGRSHNDDCHHGQMDRYIWWRFG